GWSYSCRQRPRRRFRCNTVCPARWRSRSNASARRPWCSVPSAPASGCQRQVPLPLGLRVVRHERCCVTTNVDLPPAGGGRRGETHEATETPYGAWPPCPPPNLPPLGGGAEEIVIRHEVRRCFCRKRLDATCSSLRSSRPPPWIAVQPRSPPS